MKFYASILLISTALASPFLTVDIKIHDDNDGSGALVPHQKHVAGSPPDYGNGGRYGVKKCVYKNRPAGKASCINFDEFQTNATTHLGTPSDLPLTFSKQWDIFNITSGRDHHVVPRDNHNSAVSAPNALLGSTYTPGEPDNKSPPTITATDGGTFDLFGFYIQPMAVDRDIAMGVTVKVVGYPKVGDKDREPLTWSASIPAGSNKAPLYFESYDFTGEVWDGLEKVEVSASLAGGDLDGTDWEVFVDDVWFRLPKESGDASEERVELRV